MKNGVAVDGVTTSCNISLSTAATKGDVDVESHGVWPSFSNLVSYVAIKGNLEVVLEAPSITPLNFQLLKQNQNREIRGNSGVT